MRYGNITNEGGVVEGLVEGVNEQNKKIYIYESEGGSEPIPIKFCSLLPEKSMYL
jgi:hypothetical protein